MAGLPAIGVVAMVALVVDSAWRCFTAPVVRLLAFCTPSAASFGLPPGTPQ
jgi:hypothetical protein